VSAKCAVKYCQYQYLCCRFYMAFLIRDAVVRLKTDENTGLPSIGEEVKNVQEGNESIV